MNKFIATIALSLVLTVASVASAQVYYGSGSSMACANLSVDLTIGSRSGEVRALQAFLANQNYPGGGSWMVTGYYGEATAAAVRIFQQLHNLPQTGSVDAQTRQAINAASCGGYANQYAPSYNPFSYNTSYPSYAYNSTYPYSYQYYNACGSYPNNVYYGNPCQSTSAPQLSSLNPQSGYPGMQVTIYGSGFDYAANNVYIGGLTLRNIPSYNGTTLTFVVPSNTSGVVSITVGNSRGTSNSLTFRSGGDFDMCGTYVYNNCSGCQYTCQPGTVSLNYLTPNSGAVGMNVTVYGWGFSRENNTVHFGNGIITNLRSFDGTSLSFTVPSQLSGYGYQPIGLGTYDVSVSNAFGATSNVVQFTVTSLGTSGNITISNLSGPSNLSAGQVGTWSFTVTGVSGTQISASAKWGDESGLYMSAPQQIYGTGNNTITFTHAYQNTGSYTPTFTVSNGFGLSNSASITVNVSGSNNGFVTLNSLSPSSGYVGTQILLSGSGFTGDNTIHFGVGGTMHVSSQSNSYLYFTVPAYLSPCDVMVSGSYCAQYLQQVTPGSYPVYVTNSNGTSQTRTFTVN